MKVSSESRHAGYFYDWFTRAERDARFALACVFCERARRASLLPHVLKTRGAAHALTPVPQRLRSMIWPSPVLSFKTCPPPPMRQRRTRLSAGLSATATPSLKTDSG